jgi:hypothetical protein
VDIGGLILDLIAAGLRQDSLRSGQSPRTAPSRSPNLSCNRMRWCAESRLRGKGTDVRSSVLPWPSNDVDVAFSS